MGRVRVCSLFRVVLSRLLKTMGQNRCCSRSETFRFSLAPKGVVCPAARLHRSGASRTWSFASRHWHSVAREGHLELYQRHITDGMRSPDELLVGVVSQRFQAIEHVALWLALVNKSRYGQDNYRALQATTVLARQISELELLRLAEVFTGMPKVREIGNHWF